VGRGRRGRAPRRRGRRKRPFVGGTSSGSRPPLPTREGWVDRPPSNSSSKPGQVLTLHPAHGGAPATRRACTR
jgi:hypothetical protein